MIFNYDKENGTFNNSKNLSDAKQNIIDFFTKRQDIKKNYVLTDKDNDFFKRFKEAFSDEQLSGNSEKDIAYARQLVDQYADQKQGIYDLIEAKGLLSVTEANLADAQSTTLQGMTKFQAATKTAGIAVKSFVATLGSMVAAAAAAWAIGKVFEGIDYLYHYNENIIKAGREAKESIDNTVSSIQEQQKSISDLSSKYSDSTNKEISTTEEKLDSLAKKYSELHKGVDSSTNENISLSTDNYQEYLDISNQLASIFPSLTASTDNQGNAILRLGDNAEKSAKQINEMYRSSVLAAHVDIGDNLQAVYDGNRESAEEARTKRDNYDSYQTDLKKSQEYINNMMNTPAVQSTDGFISNQGLFDENDTNVTSVDIQMTTEQQEALEYAVDQYNKHIQVSAEEVENSKKALGDAFTAPITDSSPKLFEGSIFGNSSNNKGISLLDDSLTSIQDSFAAEKLKKEKEINIDFSSPGYAILENIENWTQEDMDEFNSYYHKYLGQLMSDRLNELGKDISDSGNNIGKLDGEIKDYYNQTANTIKNYVNTDPEFLDLGSDVQNAINDYILNTMDLSNIDINEEYGSTKDFYYQMFTKVFDSLGTEDAQKAFDKVLSLNGSKLSLDNYKNSILESIKDVTPDTDLQNTIMEITGISAKMKEAENNADRLEKIFPDATSYIESLPIDSLKEYADYVDQGIDISKGWETFIDLVKKAKAATTDLGDGPTLASVLSDSESEVSTSVDSLQSDISSLSDVLLKLRTGEFKDTDLTDLIQQFPALADETDNLQEAIAKLQASKLKTTLKKIDDFMDGASAEEIAKAKTLKDSIIKSADLSDIDEGSISDLIKSAYTEDEGNAYILAKRGKKAANEYLNAFSAELKTGTGRGAFYKAVLDPTVVKGGIEAIRAAYTSYLPTAETVINDENISSELSDYTEKYQELYAAQKQIKNGLMTGANRKTFLDKFPKLAKYASSTESLSSAVDNLMASMDNNVLSQFSDKINALELAGKHQEASALKAYVQDVINGAHDIENAYAQISNMKFKTPDYERVKDAQDETNSGVMYDDIMSLYKTAKENWQKGLTGTTAFKSFAALISPTGAEDAVNFGENIAKFERYFKDSSQGCENFLKDLQALNLAEKDGEHWTTSIGNNLDEMRRAADLLGIGFEPFMSMFGKLEDYGATNDFFTTEAEGQEHLSDLYTELADKKVKLAQIKANPDLAGNTTAIKAYEDAIAELEARIDSTNVGMEELPEKAAHYEAKNLEEAKKAVLDLQKDIDQAIADGNTELANKLTLARDQMLKEKGYVLNGINTDVESKGTIEDPTSGRGFSSADSLHNYKSVVDTIQKANAEGNKSLEQSLEILSQFSESQLRDIDLFDGIYSEGDLGNAERALDSLISEFGLSKEQAAELISVLSDMGQLKVDPEVDLQTLQQQIDTVKESISDIEQETGIKIDLDFNIDEMSADDIDAKIEELQKASSELARQGYTSYAEQVNSVIDTLSNRSVDLRVQAVVESNGDLDRLYDLSNGEFSDETAKTIKKEFGITVTGQDDLDKLNESAKEAMQNNGKDISMTVQLDETQFNQLLDKNQTSNTTATITVKANTNEAKTAVDNAVSDIRKRKPQMKIDGDNDPAIRKGVSATQMINGMKGTIKVGADVSSMASAINNELQKPHRINVIASVTTHVSGTASSAPKNATTKATGTAVHIAHADGTAYNVLNYRPAHADGDVALSHDEYALVNEEGKNAESIVRDGRWMIIPGGAHFENLKKGDIVFNARQTSELIKSGRVTSGGGRGRTAYANGSVRNGLNAFDAGTYIGTRWNKDTTQVGANSSTSSTSSTKANTAATNKNTTATNDNTEKIKKSSKAWDWVERNLTYWSNRVKEVADKITDYVSSAMKTSLLKKQINTMYSQIQANTNGHVAYMQKANAVAQSYSYYNSDGDEIKVSIPEIYQQLVQRGEYNIEDMDTSTDQNKALAEAIEQYKTWYDKAQDCQQAIVELRNEQQELFEQWANMPTEKAEKKIEGLTAGYNGLTAVSSRVTAAQSGGSTQAALAKTMKDDLAKVKVARDADRKVLTDAQNANKKAVADKTKADKTVKSTTSALKKTKLTATEKAQVNAGQKIDTSNLTGSKKKRAVAYNKALDAQAKAAKKVTSTKASVTAAKKPYADSNAIYQSMNTNVKNALKNYNSKDELSYMNSIVDQEVALKKQEKNARKTAVEEANKNLIAINKQKANSDKRLAEVQKYYGNDFRLTEDQKKVMKSGKEISLDGVTDIDQIRIINEYNNALANTVKEKQDVTTATNALKTAEENLTSAEIEAAQATVDAVKTKFDNVKNYYDARLNYQKQITEINSKDSDLSQAHGDFEKSSDYTKKIKYTQREQTIADEQAKKLKEQLDAGVKSGVIKRGSDEWYDLATQLREAQNAAYDYNTQIEQLKQQQIGVYYAEQFERAVEKVDKFRDKLDGLKAIISDDMKVDKNTGLLTESGALALTLDVDDIQASTENLKTYIKERQQIINDYKADKFGKDEYNQKLKTVDDNIKNTTANINSSRSSMLDLIKTQAQAELDVLDKVIDKRKEALSAKKNYYDYDKTLKNKTKDIQILERQMAALNGSTNAEDKARRAQLQEQLSDAQDALKDTITDHAYSMQSDALDKLSTDLSEDMDEWINKISSNMEEMTNAINDAVKNAGLTTAGTINAISSILKHYGISDTEIAQSGLTDIKGYASGTDYVPKDGVYNVNENGMESVYSPKYGVLTFLNQGDKVYNADLTKSLLENAGLATKNNMPDFSGMVKTMEECMYNIQNMGGNTYISNFYVDGVDDIESLYKKLDAHLDQKIQANNKKIARDIRSLR